MPVDVEQVLERAACLPPIPWSKQEKDAVFEWSLKEEVPRMVRFAWASLRACGGNLADAEDVVADTLLGLYKNICTYDPNRSARPRVGGWGKAVFRTWAYTALRHNVWKRCRELLGQQAFPPEPPLGGEGAQLPKPAALTGDYQELLGFLPRRESQAVDLIIRLGCSHAEAAVTAGCTEGAMKVRHFTALHRLAAVHCWLETFVPGKARLLRLFVGLRLPLAEAARRIHTSETEASRIRDEACIEMGALRFARGKLMHPEVKERLCRA